MKPDTIRNCSDKLQFLPTLRHLDVSENQLGAKAGDLVQALRNCRELRSLNISRCSLNEPDVHAMVSHLSGLYRLESLNVAHNNVGSVFISLVQRLPGTMTSLVLRDCGITFSEHSPKEIHEAFLDVRLLRHLDLQENNLRYALNHLLCALAECHIEHLNVRQCVLMPNDFRVAAYMLPRLRHLQVLVIGINRVCHADDDVREKLVKYMKQSRTLTKVVCCRMLGINFTTEQIQRLGDSGIEATRFG